MFNAEVLIVVREWRRWRSYQVPGRHDCCSNSLKYTSCRYCYRWYRLQFDHVISGHRSRLLVFVEHEVAIGLICFPLRLFSKISAFLRNVRGHLLKIAPYTYSCDVFFCDSWGRVEDEALDDVRSAFGAYVAMLKSGNVCVM